jgi:tetratricopeptide (TPR) repeat protein
MSRAVPAGGSRDGFTKPLWEYLPQSQHGSVLITTRSRSVARKLVEERDIIVVEPMDKAHAVALFEKKLSIQGGQKDTTELVAAVEYMPLAIVQAAAYINQRAPQCSVREYLEKFQKTDRSKTSLLAYEAGHLRRDQDAKNSIIVTWQISFDYIQQERPSAADLLSLMSFFDRQGIPEGLLRNGSETGNRYRDLENPDSNNEGHDDEDSESATSVTDEFENDILMLKNYSFISVNIDRTIFGMHRLVQLATRKWLETHRQLERWKKHYIKSLCAEFPAGNYENWVKCGALFPHVQLALAQQPEGDDSLKEWALLLYKASWYAMLRGSFSDAEKMSVKSMKIRKKQLGQDNSETLCSQTMVALIYQLGGRWKEAEGLFVQVMETSLRILGQEHPDTLTSMDNLASIYLNQGRWKEAEELEIQVIKTKLRILEQEHPDTLISMTILASIYRNQGRWKEAEELSVQVMETSLRILGPEHPDTVTSMAILASIYRNQKRWKEAEGLSVQVMETSLRILGQEHPDTLTSMANLASIYQNQRQWKEAEELQVQVMETRKRVLGQEHPDTLAVMNNLAWTWKGQNRDVEALDLISSCLELSTRKLGADHPNTLLCTQTYNTWKPE